MIGFCLLSSLSSAAASFISSGSESAAVLSEAWAKLGDWAVLAGQGRLLLTGSIVLASLKTAVYVKVDWILTSNI